MITYPNLYYLKYFADAVDLESISAAAQKNSVTHPAISRAISNLEKHLGLELLEHRKKSFKVTEAGYRVAQQARVLLASASSFNQLGLVADGGEPTRFSIGISRSLSAFYLPPLLQELKAQFPNVQVQIRFGTTYEIIEAVTKKTIDLGITIGTQTLPTLKQATIRAGQFVLVEAPHAKGAREHLESKSFLLTEPRLETETLKQDFQKQFGSPLLVAMEIRSWEVIGQLVLRGFGVGLVPDILVKDWKKSSFRELRPAWFRCQYDVYIHQLRKTAVSPVLQFAIERLRVS